MFGREVVPALLAGGECELILLVHESGCGVPAAQLARDMFGLSPEDARHVTFVQGDVREPGLGLNEADHGRVTTTVTHILHSAAITRFDRPLGDVRATNVDGTRHMVALARECPCFEAFGHVSSAYMAGRRTGVVLEDDLVHDAGFVNTYEQSKYEAELYLRDVGDLPLAVYRLSTVVGNSRTGAVLNFTAPHHAMRMMHLGLASMVPGSADYPVDMIPGDVVAEAVAELLLHRFRSGDVFHLAAGPERSYTLEQVIESVFDTFGHLDPEWQRRRYPRPVLASSDAFTMFLDAIEAADNPFFVSVLRTVRHFADQLNYPKVFDMTRLLDRMPEYADRMPNIDDYYPKVIRYCVETDWGRHVA